MSNKNTNKNKNKGGDIMGFDDVAVAGNKGPTTYEIEDSIKIEMELEDLSNHLFPTTDDAGDDSFIKAALSKGDSKQKAMIQIIYSVTKDIIAKAISGEEVIKNDLSKMIVSRSMAACSKDPEFKKDFKTNETKKKFNAKVQEFIESEMFEKELDRLIDTISGTKTTEPEAENVDKPTSEEPSVFLVSKLKNEGVVDTKEVVVAEVIEEKPTSSRPVVNVTYEDMISKHPMYREVKPMLTRPTGMKEKQLGWSGIIARRDDIKLPC